MGFATAVATRGLCGRPLDPFRAIELTSLSYFFRVQFSLLIPN